MTVQAHSRSIKSQERRFTRSGAFTLARLLLAMPFLLAAASIAEPAFASTNLRVEALPINAPIEAFITVTDGTGVPVGGLTAGDFIMTLDGLPISIQASNLTLPPAQDPNQKVSVVFAMDFSPSVTGIALTAMQNAVIDFINAMRAGDYAAIVKFNNTNPARASVVWPFTQIDQGAGNLALANAVMDAYPGNGTNLLDAINVSMGQFIAPASPLPAGPKAIIVITDGGENASTVTASDAVAAANDNSIPIFIIGVGDITIQKRINLMTALTTETGGQYLPAPGDAEIAAAYASISHLLNNEYLVTIPANAVTDCGQHVLRVTVTGQPAPASASFGRCDITPDPFDFPNKRNVTPSSTVTSSAVTISGINGPAPISVTGGEYSIGCGSANFRASNSMINNGDTVCVRHTAAAAFSTETITTLSIGGVSGDFKSTTKDAPPPRGGGGGATGALDLLLGLAVLIARRRQRS